MEKPQHSLHEVQEDGNIPQIVAPDPEAWARTFKAILDPKTPEEHAIALESRKRVTESEEALRKKLPYSTGKLDHVTINW